MCSGRSFYAKRRGNTSLNGGTLMGPVERKIRQSITKGMTLKTVPGAAEFRVGGLLDDELVLLFGEKEARTCFRWKDLETIPGFLSGRGWVEIGAQHVTTGVPGTLDGYFKQNHFVRPLRTCGGYIAGVLRVSGIIEVNPSLKPARVRLRNDWNK
jgi:hypothetical protein